jgi:hypothetical protein
VVTREETIMTGPDENTTQDNEGTLTPVTPTDASPADLQESQPTEAEPDESTATRFEEDDNPETNVGDEAPETPDENSGDSVG